MKENPYFETVWVGGEPHTINRFPEAVRRAAARVITDAGVVPQTLYIGRCEEEAMKDVFDRSPRASISRRDEMLPTNEFMGMRVFLVNEPHHLAAHPAIPE